MNILTMKISLRHRTIYTISITIKVSLDFPSVGTFKGFMLNPIITLQSAIRTFLGI